MHLTDDEPYDADPAATAIEIAFSRAEFSAVRALLAVVQPASDSDSSRIDLVRARLARIDRDASACYAAAARAAARTSEPERKLFALALKAGAAVAGARRRGDGEREFADLERTILAADPAHAGPATYLLAVNAWQNGDYERSGRLIERSLTARVDVAESRALLGWIDVARERFTAAAGHFERALAALDASGQIDVRLRGTLVHGIASIASETVDLALGERARAAYDATRWTADLAIMQSNALGALRYLALLEGDLDRAWLLARSAATIVESGPYAILGEVGAALVSRALGDRRALAVQLEHAWQLVRDFGWGDADREERIALLDFATVAAVSTPAQARQAFVIYQSLAETPNPMNSLDHDRRWQAAELTAAARVSEALGQRRSALEAYHRAYALWRELSHTMRAAQVAVDLRRLTGEDRYAAAVVEALRSAPRAWLLAELPKADDALGLLTKSERRVFSELLAGKSTKTIAMALGRSPHTINNHTRKIFAAFNVRSRGRLLARCSELGISADTFGEAAQAAAGMPAKRKRSAGRHASKPETDVT